MSRLIVCSSKDAASLNIIRNLKKLMAFEETKENFDNSPISMHDDIGIVTVETDITECEHLKGRFHPEFAVFASRHKSAAGTSSLTVHAPGILQSEGEGGESKPSFGVAHPVLQMALLTGLRRSASSLGLDSYQVSLEATHHGPITLDFPVSFIEIGGSETQWRNETAGEAVAQAIFTALKNLPTAKNAIGLGGGHYAPKHTSTALQGEYAIGHIIPKYSTDALVLPLISAAAAKTYGGCGALIVDWKGVGSSIRKEANAISQQLQLAMVRV